MPAAQTMIIFMNNRVIYSFIMLIRLFSKQICWQRMKM